ncbi:MAG: hypothetical protein MJ002_05635 [Paludibacteraceae bacterium]|nr:hypothetical protein [Paludibacteraceae bacterium]
MPSCTTQRQSLRNETLSRHRLTLKASDTTSILAHTLILDTIHILERETIWLPPDTLGVQYPLRTVTKESGSNRITHRQETLRHRDTIFLSSDRLVMGNSESKPSPPQWLPWLFILFMLTLAIAIIALRIFLPKR